MDRFIDIHQNYGVHMESQDVHVLGITSLIISSKLEEIIPIKIQDLITKAAHNKFTVSQIKS